VARVGVAARAGRGDIGGEDRRLRVADQPDPMWPVAAGARGDVGVAGGQLIAVHARDVMAASNGPSDCLCRRSNDTWRISERRTPSRPGTHSSAAAGAAPTRPERPNASVGISADQAAIAVTAGNPAAHFRRPRLPLSHSHVQRPRPDSVVRSMGARCGHIACTNRWPGPNSDAGSTDTRNHPRPARLRLRAGSLTRCPAPPS
jgi:hypothetical protein